MSTDRGRESGEQMRTVAGMLEAIDRHNAERKKEPRLCRCGKVDARFSGLRGWMVRCPECGKSTRWYDSRDSAINAWNRRKGGKREL